MYGLHEISSGLACITLPPDGLPLPWGTPRNVFVLRSDEGGGGVVLIDCGWGAQADTLIRALSELALTPAHVSAIVATSHRPDAVGAAASFPAATVYTAVSAGDETDELWNLPAIEREARMLLSAPFAPASWSENALVEELDILRRQQVSPPNMTPVLQGLPLRVAGRTLVPEHLAGHGPGHAAWRDPDNGDLFAGIGLISDPPPLSQRPSDAAATTVDLAATEPASVFPAHGPPQREPRVALRSASLFAQNFSTNLQYVLKDPSTAENLVYTDLGSAELPLLRFAVTSLTWRHNLDALVAAGVVSQGPGGTYQLGSRG